MLKHFQQRIYLIFIWNNLNFYTKIIRKQIKVASGGIRAHWLMMRTQVNLLLTLTFVDMQHQIMLRRQSCIKMISRSFRAPRIQAASPNAYIVCLDTLANFVYCKYLVITFINPGPLIFQKNLRFYIWPVLPDLVTRLFRLQSTGMYVRTYPVCKLNTATIY